MEDWKPRTIRPSSLSLLRKLILTELALLGLVAILAPFANYAQLYTDEIGWRIHFYRYDLLMVAIASLAQIAATLFVFFSWEHEIFSINQGEITYRSGIFLTRETSVHLNQVSSVIYRSSPISRYFRTGTIVLRCYDRKNVILKNIDQAKTWLKIIRELVAEQQALSSDSSTISVEQIIAGGENSRTEFKRSLRFDDKLGASNRALEKAVLKTTAAFLNSDGGKLLIGVNDTGEVAGIESDYQVIQRGDRDGFENHFTQVFKSMIDVRFRRFVRLKFKRINGREICVIAVSPAPEPVFLKTGEAEEFFIRTGNTTSLLSLKQALDYINRHFV